MTFGESMHTMSFADSVESAIPLHLTKGSQMATYRDVKRQIAELEKQAEVLRKAEAVKVIANIKSQIQRFDLKPADLFDDLTTDRSITASPVPVASVAPGVAVKATPAKKSRSVAKYMERPRKSARLDQEREQRRFSDRNGSGKTQRGTGQQEGRSQAGRQDKRKSCTEGSGQARCQSGGKTRSQNARNQGGRQARRQVVGKQGPASQETSYSRTGNPGPGCQEASSCQKARG